MNPTERAAYDEAMSYARRPQRQRRIPGKAAELPPSAYAPQASDQPNHFNAHGRVLNRPFVSGSTS